MDFGFDMDMDEVEWMEAMVSLLEDDEGSDFDEDETLNIC